MRVASGPFAGMLVSAQHVYGAPVAKLLGTYEKELHPHVRELLLPGDIALVFDVGAAEGYYAVGMALQPSVRQVVAWESLAAGRDLIRQQGHRNGVAHKVRIEGACDEAILYQSIVESESSGLLIMDIEGGELDLLSPRVCRVLAGWKIILETHDFLRNGSRDILMQRLQATHTATLVVAKQRNPEEFPFDIRMAPSLKKQLMNEGRPQTPMEWLIAAPLPSKGG